MPTTRRSTDKQFYDRVPPTKIPKITQGRWQIVVFCCFDSRKYVCRKLTVRFQKRDQGSNHKNKPRRLGPSTTDLTESIQLKTVVSSCTQHEKLDQIEREDTGERPEIGTHTLAPDGTCRKERAQPTSLELTELDMMVNAVPKVRQSRNAMRQRAKKKKEKGLLESTHERVDVWHAAPDQLNATTVHA
eukprot:scaffold120021_cov43-Attheya_sp.AAC.1